MVGVNIVICLVTVPAAVTGGLLGERYGGCGKVIALTGYGG